MTFLRFILFVIVPEQLHQNIQVLDYNVSAAEFAGAVSAASQLLLPVPAGTPAHPGHLLADAHNHGHPTDWGARSHCRQRRLR